MDLFEKRNITIYIKMFVHYPEAYNANAISNKFNMYFKEYFSENKFIDYIYNQDCYVMINSAPYDEEESLEIEVCFDKNEVTSINKEAIILNWKEFVIDYFNNQIKDIDIEFVNNK